MPLLLIPALVGLVVGIGGLVCIVLEVFGRGPLAQ